MKLYQFCLVLAIVAAFITSTNAELPGKIVPKLVLWNLDYTALFPTEKCKLPAKVGRCRGGHRRFYYNQEAKACEEFVYGGCRGNANRFKSVEECKSECTE